MEGKITKVEKVEKVDPDCWLIYIDLDPDGPYINKFFIDSDTEPDVKVGQRVHVDVTPIYDSVEDIPKEAFQ